MTPQQQATAAFYTLGCKLNFSETSGISRQLAAEGLQTIPFSHPQGADIYIINTCSVTDNADKKCRAIIRKALRANAHAKIVVLGCYAQLKPKEIANIPGVDLVLGAAEKFNLAHHLNELLNTPKTNQQVAPMLAGKVSQANFFISSWSGTEGERTRSFLKVQDGCDYQCAFCTIPLARGNSRSDTPANVLANAQKIADTGVKEIVLTGINTGDYGRRMANGTDKAYTFYQLLQLLDTQLQIPRIRVSSIEPNLLTPEIIQLVANSQRLMPHFHIPLQSGSDTMLGLMRRRYRTKLYAQRVQLIKQLMPHACIGVDVITGHPGETEARFKESYQFINQLPISYLHVFTYSERPNTYALQLEPVVPTQLRRERTAQLRQLSNKKQRAFYQQHIGSTRPVLLESANTNSSIHGFTDNYIKVTTTYQSDLDNTIQAFQLNSINPQCEVIGKLHTSPLPV